MQLLVRPRLYFVKITTGHRYTQQMEFHWGAIFGFMFGFMFGVGCALAVMYSIYMGGYRAALRDARLPIPPERYRKAIARLDSTQG